MDGIIGRKLGMTRVFDDEGRATPVTVIEAGPCPVVQVRERQGPQRWAVQLGFGAVKPKRALKPQVGHAKRAGLDAVPAVLREFVVTANEEPAEVTAVSVAPPAPGQLVTVSIFQPGDFIKVTGTTKGRGFQGVVKRHGFGGGPATHGNTRHRKPGSVGPGTDPSRVIKGKRMPGHMGAARHTEVGLRVVRVDSERNLLFVRGAVPGPMRGIVAVRKQGGRGRYA
ncbi:MAG: 50S ribosomal protein L3 [Gemmatimonadetes bacterium]|nr:50S ribosomal protein L3 [Gemmatimonadota bacterium]